MKRVSDTTNIKVENVDDPDSFVSDVEDDNHPITMKQIQEKIAEGVYRQMEGQKNNNEFTAKQMNKIKLEIKFQIEKYDVVLKKQLDDKLKKMKKIIWQKFETNEKEVKRLGSQILTPGGNDE